VNPIEAFETLDLRVGRIVRAEPNERARKPAYRLWIDFGPLGEKTSSAQLRALYSTEALVGRLVVAAVNLGTRNIAGFTSEVLVLGYEHRPPRGVERRRALVDPERGHVVHALVDRAALGAEPGDGAAREAREVGHAAEAVTHLGREAVP
jgi:tRNA-binding protein